MELKKTLAEQIHQILKNDILSQKIKPGEKLTLKVLKERFEVSSTPIREALTRLTEEGLISYYSNIGVSVVSLNEDDVHEIYPFMGDLDSLAIRYSSQYDNLDEVKNAIRENIEKADNAFGDKKRWNDISDEFHLLFYKYCNNSRLVSAAQKMRSQLSILSYQYQESEEIEKKIHREHKEIAEAFCQDEFLKAENLMKEHLLHSMDYALELI